MRCELGIARWHCIFISHGIPTIKTSDITAVLQESLPLSCNIRLLQSLGKLAKLTIIKSKILSRLLGYCAGSAILPLSLLLLLLRFDHRCTRRGR